MISAPTSNFDLALNTKSGPTADLAVRKALEMGIDKELISENVFYGMRPSADFIFDRTLPYCDVDVTTYSYDPEQAVSLLEEAGWTDEDGDGIREKDGEPLSIDYIYTSADNVAKSLGEVLQGMYGELGIALNITGLDIDAFEDSQKEGTFGIIISETPLARSSPSR